MTIRIDDLPAASVEAARIALAEALANDGDGLPEAVLAAINAWPGMREAKNGSSISLKPHIILPLTEVRPSDYWEPKEVGA